MNKVILMGRLTRDPDVRYSQGQTPTAIARYTLAVDRRFTKRDDPNAPTADFISCVAFGKSGEFVEKYLKKGTKICVSGRIQTGSYVNKDGQKVYTTEVVVDDHEFAESKNSQGGSGMMSTYGNGAPSDFAAAMPAPMDGQGMSADPSFMDISGGSEEIPFN